jgi:transposase
LANHHVTEALGGWTGYSVGTVRRFEAGEKGTTPRVWIDLHRTDGPFVCSACGRSCDKYHDHSERWVRDLPILGAETHLCFPRFRVACPTCGPKLEHLPWLSKHARVTMRFAEHVAALCEVMSIKHVAALYRLSWNAVKAIDKASLQRRFGEPDLSNLTTLAIDEFAIQKGHRYATIFVDPTNKRVLWVCRGRSREEIRPFFEKLGPDRCARIEAVAIDMSAAFEAEVRHQCPNAAIVYDRFHIIAKYGREVVDRVRGSEARRDGNHREDRKLIKGSRWLLLRNKRDLGHHDRVRLKELLSINRRLATTYILKDDLKQLWTYVYADAALRFWRGWYHRAVRSRIDPLKRFARNLHDKIDGILAHCVYPLHTSLLEGMNNKIKTLKRMAYGYRDDEYFFLKIRRAFPGNQG